MRLESAADRRAVHDLLARAFASDAEARLVDALRTVERRISLVADHPADGVLGHILFTPVEIGAPSGIATAVGLAPLAVRPGFQRRGIGSALVEAGLAACRDAGEPFVTVLGHPAYYPRFGFQPAWDFGLYYGAPGPNPAFLVRELEAGALRDRSGEVRYHPAFRNL